jgi:hypothetical protein
MLKLKFIKKKESLIIRFSIKKLMDEVDIHALSLKRKITDIY